MSAQNIVLTMRTQDVKIVLLKVYAKVTTKTVL